MNIKQTAWTGLLVALLIEVAGLTPAMGAEMSRGDAFAIKPFLQNPGKTNMTIRWVAGRPASFAVRWWPSPGESPLSPASPAGERRRSGEEEMGMIATGADTACSATITGLKPGTTYGYEVHSEGAAASGTFRTVPDGPAAFTFIAYGDSRSKPDLHRKVVAAFAPFNPAFILHTGDLVTSGAYSEWKREFFEPLDGVIGNVPVWPAWGNHDENFSNYFDRPVSQMWYSFDYGTAHVTCLMSGTKDSRMLEWCQRDLAASKAEWKFVFYHFPSYDLGSHHSSWGREDYLPVFRATGVDLVFTGHSHSYQRFRPVFVPGENERRPITHIVAAGGGAPIHRFPEGDPRLAAGAAEYNFVVVTVEGNRISVRALTPDGRELDFFAYRKTDGAVEPAWQALARPEAEFDKL